MERNDLMKTVDVNKVKAAKLENGWSDEALAGILGCKESTLKQKLCFATTWTLDDLVALSKASGKPVGYFLTKEAVAGTPGGF